MIQAQIAADPFSRPPRLRAAFVLQAVVVLGLRVPVESAQPAAPDGPGVVAVQFVGLHHTPEVIAGEIAGIQVGESLSTTALDEAVARLMRSGRFLAVSYAIEQADRGVRVEFTVRERPVVTAIRIEGNVEFREKTIRDKVEQKINQPLDLLTIRESRDSIITMYREKGYGDVTVTVDEAQVERTGELVFRIDEGPRTRVRAIRFEGNATFSERELRKEVHTKTAFWFIRSGAFEKDIVEADVARLRTFYRDEGFLDAEASVRSDTTPEGDLTLTFVITEGVRYSIESIEFRGYTVLSLEELRGLIASREGQTVIRPIVDRDARTIQSRYGEMGFIYSGVRSLRVFSEQPGLVRITFEINEGEQFRVGRVAVRGNTRTKDKVARRALNLYPPDDLFNLTEAREAEKRLLDTRIFSAVRVIPVGDQPGVRDAVIDVTEAEKAGDLLFGAGITSNAGLVGSIVLDMQNFDLFDWPQTWSELFKLRAFYGGGQRMRIELQPGTELGRYRLDFTEPYLFDRPIRFDAGLYLFSRERDGYTESRTGTTVGLGKRFERGRFRDWSGEVALRLESVTIDNVDLFTSKEVKDEEGNNPLASVKGTLVRDRTDSRFVPTAGDRLSISYEQYVAPDVFGKVNLRYDWYATLATDSLDRKHVLALKSDGGVILGDAPVYERYFAGGIGSIRGFEFRGIGERDGLDDTNVGGDFLVLLGTEYSYPLYGDNLRGQIFLDTGTVGGGTYRAAVGTGIRLHLNLLGPLPIELNVAMPISEDEDDDTQVFSFIVGRVF